MEADYTETMAVELPAGEVIRAEVSWTEPGDVSRITEKLRIDEVTDMVRHMGQWAVQTVSQGLPQRPDEFEVEFGVKLGLESGNLVGILAKASGEASLTVHMTWRKDT
ncbi:CU044_2847 family protein [Streptomyces sp. Lzd4kr]|nr:CU044_2847 family protein [Streptomyces sp. Lzd4kr]